MKTASLTPCTNWVTKLAATNSDELSYTERIALHEHLAMCSACTTAYATYRNVGNLINSLSPIPPTIASSIPSTNNFPHALLQHTGRSISRKERIHVSLTGKLTHLKSLLVAFTLFLQRVDYACDNHYCYALRDSSGFLLWRYKKSEVFFSFPAVKDGTPYIRASDAPLFQFAARVRPCSSSFLWKM